MKHVRITLTLAALALLGADAPDVKGKPNLIPNGDFEAGEETPDGWQKVDGLLSFWEKAEEPDHGKVIRFDTDVLQSQAYDWWDKIADGASARDAPKKLPTVEPKYDTIAGLDGAWYWSDYIPVEKGKAYWLTIDAKGPGMMAWLFGYPEKKGTEFGSEEGAFLEYRRNKRLPKLEFKGRNHEPTIHGYNWKGQLTLPGSEQWKTHSRRSKPFRPTANTPNVRYVRVMIYPFWPPAGNYFVDNVRLVEVAN